MRLPAFIPCLDDPIDIMLANRLGPAVSPRIRQTEASQLGPLKTNPCAFALEVRFEQRRAGQIQRL